jgi:hypothetical protein
VPEQLRLAVHLRDMLVTDEFKGGMIGHGILGAGFLLLADNVGTPASIR